MTNSQLTQKHSIPQQHNGSVSSRNKKANMNKKFNKNMKQQQPTLKDGNDMATTPMAPNKKQQVKNKKKPHQQTNINSTDIVMNANSPQQHHQQQKQQQRRNILPVKVRRMERRKDIVSMTDALETSQIDILSSSPPVLSSATESEDSDPCRLNRNRYKKNSSNKKHPSLGNDDAFPPLMNQQQQQQTNKKSGSPPRRQRKHQENKVIYAGPTFNNAPAPSCLPIPPPSLNNNSNSSVSQDHEDVFYMEVVPPRPTYHQPDFQQQSRDLMNLLAPRYAAPPPPPMMTMMPTTNYPPRDHTLSQIQRDLRSILKLEVAS